MSDAYLTPLLRDFTGEPGLKVSHIDVRRWRRGTSGSALFRVRVRLHDRPGDVSLVLKLDEPGELTEVGFFRDLAARVPIVTPRALDARVLSNNGGWILMEELIGAKPRDRWTQDEHRGVVGDMAKLQAAYWGRADRLDAGIGLWQPDLDSFTARVADIRSSGCAIEASGLLTVLPKVLDRRRLRLVGWVLDHADEVLDPLLAAGTTLVQGDYWFHNIQILPDGRRALLDWQNCHVFSGLWELVYYLDLGQVLGTRSFRSAPAVPHDRVIRWYAESLREHGVSLPQPLFEEALACARIWHPLAHWLTRYGRMAEYAAKLAPWRIVRRAPPVGRLVATGIASPGALRFLEGMWARWEDETRKRFGDSLPSA